MSEQGILTLQTVAGDGLRFEAEFPTGRIVMDSGASPAAPNPMHHLLAALAACEGMDVISLLRKKRQQVSGYAIHMSGERSTEHPRRYTAVKLVHRVTGHGLQANAMEDSLRLTAEKYCSVYHTLRPDLTITSTYELIEG